MTQLPLKDLADNGIAIKPVRKSSFQPRNGEKHQGIKLLTKFMIALAIIIAIGNLLEMYLYQKSNEYFKLMSPYKTPVMTEILRFFSNLGEGDPYMIGQLLIAAYGSVYEYNYFSMCFCATLWIGSLLKTAHHSPRPYFDEPSMIDGDLHDCAGEYGNPSAHALMAGQYFLMLSLYYKDKYKQQWDNLGKLTRIVLNVLQWCVVLSICFSRFYAGRHSIDQLIYGFVLGIWCAYFSHYYFKPYIYDPCNRKDMNHWKHLFWVQVIVSVMYLAMIGIFLHVEYNVKIPSHWIPLIGSICPRLKESDILHYATLSQTSYLIYIPTYYLMKALNHEYFKLTNIYQPSEPTFLKPTVSFFEFITKITMYGVIDYITSRTIPIMIYGTHRLPYVQEMFARKMPFTIILVFAINGPIEKYMQQLFRDKSKNKAAAVETLKKKDE